MKKKNTGKPTESDFERVLTRLGKRAYFKRLVDAAEVYARVGRRGFTTSQPSDYIVTLDGQTFFAEVKSTVDPVSLKPSLLKSGQIAHARQIVAAGGSYLIFVQALSTKEWFCFPFNAFPTSSTPWKELSKFKWHLPT